MQCYFPCYIHTVTIKYVYEGVYVTHNYNIRRKVCRQQLTTILFLVICDLNFRIELGNQLFWIQHIQSMY